MLFFVHPRIAVSELDIAMTLLLLLLVVVVVVMIFCPSELVDSGLVLVGTRILGALGFAFVVVVVAVLLADVAAADSPVA